MKIEFTIVCDILAAIPDAFNVQPRGDYRRLVSHSNKTLSDKAWSRTGKQMRSAMKTIDKRLSHG